MAERSRQLLQPRCLAAMAWGVACGPVGRQTWFVLLIAVWYELLRAEGATPERDMFNGEGKVAVLTYGDEQPDTLLQPQSTEEARKIDNVLGQASTRSPSPDELKLVGEEPKLEDEDAVGITTQHVERSGERRRSTRSASRHRHNVKVLTGFLSLVAVSVVLYACVVVLRKRKVALIPVPEVKPGEVPKVHPPGVGEKVTRKLEGLKGLTVTFFGPSEAPDGSTPPFDEAPVQCAVPLLTNYGVLSTGFSKMDLDVEDAIVDTVVDKNLSVTDVPLGLPLTRIREELHEAAWKARGELVERHRQDDPPFLQGSFAYNSKILDFPASTAFLHIMKPEYRPHSELNRGFIFAPLPGSGEDQRSFDANYIGMINSVIGLVKEYNESPMGQKEPVQAIRMPVFDQMGPVSPGPAQDNVPLVYEALRLAALNHGQAVEVQFVHQRGSDVSSYFTEMEEEYQQGST